MGTPVAARFAVADRRRASRFASPGAEGALRILRDVRVERVEADGITVLAPERPVMQEQVIQLRDRSGRRLSVRVHPLESTLVTNGEVLRHRVKLRVLGADDSQMRPGEALDVSPDSIAVLVRRVNARAINVSASGCCLELSEPVGEGSIALLDILGIQRGAGDAVRLCRAAKVQGAAWPWNAGVEFLPLDTPGPTSMRSVAARLEALMESRSLVAARHKSGSDQTNTGPVVDLSDAVASTTIDGTLNTGNTMS